MSREPTTEEVFARMSFTIAEQGVVRENIELAKVEASELLAAIESGDSASIYRAWNGMTESVNYLGNLFQLKSRPAMAIIREELKEEDRY